MTALADRPDLAGADAPAGATDLRLRIAALVSARCDLRLNGHSAAIDRLWRAELAFRDRQADIRGIRGQGRQTGTDDVVLAALAHYIGLLRTDLETDKHGVTRSRSVVHRDNQITAKIAELRAELESGTS